MAGALGLFVLAVVASEIQAQITVNDCPPTLPRDRYLKAFDTSCYLFVTSHERDFPSAERECESRRGHLVTVKNSAVQNFLYNTLRNEFHFDGVLWIGLTDKSSEGHFTWIDGSPVHYTNWADGQPGILGFLEDCAGMDMSSTGHWHDFRCEGILFVTSDHYFVCEYPVTVTTTTTTTSTTTTTQATTTVGAVVTDPTPEPTPEPTTAPPVTDVTHSHAPHTTHQHTTHPHTGGHGQHTVTTTQCPPFECGLDCGLSGYKLSPEGCMMCECES